MTDSSLSPSTSAAASSATMTSPALLRLLNLVSPALPIGAFAYSQGLEYAIECEWVNDEETMADWLSGVLSQSLAQLDVPVLMRCYQALAEDDWAQLEQWNLVLLASRESRELRLEDQQIGAALTRLLQSLEIPGAERLKTLAPTLPLAFSLAAYHWQVPLREAALGFLWSWAENQVAAATKTIPLGQTSGQKILAAIIDKIPAAVEQGLAVEDDDIGCNLPGLAIGSALHETQYSRLFRS